MENEKKIYTIATAHLDTSWVWTFETSVKEYIPNTFNENFELFEKYPEYKFNFEGSYRYELMKEYYPEAYERVRQYIAEGKWNPCGSCYENGDVNIPSPEALIRNIIYGNGYFRDEFNKDSNDIFLPDCFGFGKALPSIAAHCGLKGFSTQKLTWGCAAPVPFDIGKWIGLDGKGLWCAIKPRSYTKRYKEIRTDKEILARLNENQQKYGFNSTFDYHGVGDRGGAPKECSVKTVIEELKENPKNSIKVLSSSVKDFFEDVNNMSEEAKNKLPVYKGEFLMTEHGAGSYTSRTVSKRWNKRSELLADAAERSCVSAFINGLADYPINALDTAWKRTIAHQFHDDITGTSWMIDYKRNWNDYVQSMNIFSAEYAAAVKALTGNMDTEFAIGIPVAVSAPVQSVSAVKQAVSARISSSLIQENVKVFDCEGNEVPSQIEDDDTETFKKIIFLAEVPSNGVSIYDIRPSKTGYDGNTDLYLEGNILENKNYRVEINDNGDISSIYDKNIGKELLSEPIRMELINDISYYHYSAWEVKYKDIMRKPYAYASVPTFRITENGPARCTIETIRDAGGSKFRQYISLDSESNFIRVYNEVDWRSESSNLKVSFPLNCKNNNAFYDIGIGRFERPTNTKNQFEVPAQRWADITDESGLFGVSIFSDSRTGWDKPDSNTLRLTAIHTATNNHQYLSGQNVADFGLNRFSFGIYGHNGAPDAAPDEAEKFCQPMHTFICDKHEGKLGKTYSLCSVSSNSVRILGIKKAQKSDDIIIRLCESSGNKQDNIEISFSHPISNATEIRGDETEIENIKVSKGILKVDFKPFEIRSFKLSIKKDKLKKDKNEYINLPYNLEASSYNNDLVKTKLPNGYSIPAELIPDNLYTGGISYKLLKDGKNCVICQGQTISLPEGTNTVHLILTSLEGDRRATFMVDSEERSTTIHNCFEAVGAWDLIGLGETGYIKKHKQCYTFTHTHDINGDAYAKQFYIFHRPVLCNGASELKLPDDPSILVFAATAEKSSNIAVPADDHFDVLKKRKFNYNLSAYSESLLKESKFEKKMKDIREKIKSINNSSILDEKKIEKLADSVEGVSDFFKIGKRKIHVAKLVTERTVIKLLQK